MGHKMAPCHFVFNYNWQSVSDFYYFCTSGNGNEYSAEELQNLLPNCNYVPTLPGKTKTR